MLEELIAVDREWRLNLTKLNELRHQRKQVTIEIAKLKKAGKEADNEVRKAQDIDVKIKDTEKQVTEKKRKLMLTSCSFQTCLMTLFRLGKDSNDNVASKNLGNNPKFQFSNKKSHRLSLGFRSN